MFRQIINKNRTFYDRPGCVVDFGEIKTKIVLNVPISFGRARPRRRVRRILTAKIVSLFLDRNR